MSTSLNAGRRARDLEWLDTRHVVDILVVGAGVTGTGVALDAASRGLSVVLIDKHDLAFGTSRWSSKLVHGGLRYLASGQVALARESAIERGIMMTRTAPHLVRALPSLLPLLPEVTTRQAAMAHTGYLLGDLLRTSVGTSSSVLPRMRRLTGTETSHLVPAVSRRGLRGGLLAWDGQLIDDARLVVTIARTSAALGARVITRCAAESVTGDGAMVRDQVTGTSHEVRARAVINATGVWAGDLVPGIHIRPSRGTHLVLSGDSICGGAGVQLTVPVPGKTNRFVFALPQADGRVYVGLTDEPCDGPIPDVPEPTEPEVEFLLTTLNSVLTDPVHRSDVLGAFAGLRPLLDRTGATGAAGTADLTRRHAVLTGPNGVITVVGGKLTTYRRMAEDAIDAAVVAGRVHIGPCVTKKLPLVGAAGTAALARLNAPQRLVARYGTLATEVLAEASANPAWLEPVAEGVETTVAELRHAVRHEGALDEGDLLDRRTRVGLVDADRARVEEAARMVLAELT